MLPRAKGRDVGHEGSQSCSSQVAQMPGAEREGAMQDGTLLPVASAPWARQEAAATQGARG